MNRASNTFFFYVIILLFSGCVPFGNYSEVTLASVDNLTWDKGAYDYGSVNLGSNTTQTFTYQNLGSRQATLCSSVTLSDTTNFTLVSDGCTSSSMQPNETCDVQVAINPSTVGTYSLTLSRSCNYETEVRTSQSLITAVVVPAAMAWSPDTKNFNSMSVNSNSSAQIFTLSSGSQTAVTGCGLVTLSNTLDFTITADSCGVLDLGLNGSCSVTVVANPQSGGVKKATLSRSCSSGGTVSTKIDKIKSPD